MTKIVALLTQRPGMEREEFRKHWRATHGLLLVQIPSMRKYIQNHVIPDPAQDDTPRDGVAEMWFDSPEAFQDALSSPRGRRQWPTSRTSVTRRRSTSLRLRRCRWCDLTEQQARRTSQKRLALRLHCRRSRSGHATGIAATDPSAQPSQTPAILEPECRSRQMRERGLARGAPGTVGAVVPTPSPSWRPCTQWGPVRPLPHPAG